ncbi:MAG: hypothetical protein ACM3XN_07240 [Chloroflexota bacterium]
MDAHSAADAYRGWLETLEFDSDGYITAIIQDRRTRSILTLSRMNRESLERTLATGRTWLYSKRQRRLLHSPGDRAAFRPVVEILESDDHCALIFYVDRVAGENRDPARFAPALVRDDGDGAATVRLLGLAKLVDELNEVFALVAERLRVLPVGLTHTFKCVRSLLRDAERSAQDHVRLRDLLAAVIARLLVFAAARGIALQGLLVAVHGQLVAEAAGTAGGSLNQECQ